MNEEVQMHNMVLATPILCLCVAWYARFYTFHYSCACQHEGSACHVLVCNFNTFFFDVSNGILQDVLSFTALPLLLWDSTVFIGAFHSHSFK